MKQQKALHSNIEEARHVDRQAMCGLGGRPSGSTGIPEGPLLLQAARTKPVGQTPKKLFLFSFGCFWAWFPSPVFVPSPSGVFPPCPWVRWFRARSRPWRRRQPRSRAAPCKFTTRKGTKDARTSTSGSVDPREHASSRYATATRIPSQSKRASRPRQMRRTQTYRKPPACHGISFHRACS